MGLAVLGKEGAARYQLLLYRFALFITTNR